MSQQRTSCGARLVPSFLSVVSVLKLSPEYNAVSEYRRALFNQEGIAGHMAIELLFPELPIRTKELHRLNR